MKVIDIIDAMTRDSKLAESSCLFLFYEDDSVKEWANRIFGQYHVKDGGSRNEVHHSGGPVRRTCRHPQRMA